MNKIRRATESEKDKEILIDLYHKLLSHHENHGYNTDMLAVRANAERLYDVEFLRGIRNGDPVLIAESLVGDRTFNIGALWWVEADIPFDMPSRIATGWGTYVIPTRRQHGVGTALRSTALSILRERGIDEVRGVVHVGNHTHIPSEMLHNFETIGLCYRIIA